MILQDELNNSGFIDVFNDDVSKKCGIKFADFFDPNQQPEGLLGIYISETMDDLYILIDGMDKDINSLCDKWDDQIRIFTIVNGNSATVQKLKYNVVQLVIYSGDNQDKSKETNLLISRKIFIKGIITANRQIVIDEKEAIELPFYIIKGADDAPDEERQKQLKQLEKLIPTNDKLLELLDEYRTKASKKGNNGITGKTFKKSEFDDITEWLKP